MLKAEHLNYLILHIGHQAPVSAVKFSPSKNTLVSCSWDGTVRIWDLFEGSKCMRELITLGTDALGLDFRPDGKQFAVSTMTGSVRFFDPESGEEVNDGINGRQDLEMSQSENELIKDDKKYFTSICYSMDGEYIICGGRSKYMCIYNVKEKIITKKFPVTWNLSLDGMYNYINKRKIMEFGFNVSNIADREAGALTTAINLPGVKRGDFSNRSVNPQIAVFSVEFSPTMRSFVASTTEGVVMYSIDIGNNFDPYQLSEDVTESSVKLAIANEEYSDAIMQSLKLNEKELVREAFESVPANSVSLVSTTFPIPYVEKCLKYLVVFLEDSKHIEFYLNWIHVLLQNHGVMLKDTNHSSLDSILRSLQRNLTKHLDDIGNLCEYNKHMLAYITSKVKPERET